MFTLRPKFTFSGLKGLSEKWLKAGKCLLQKQTKPELLRSPKAHHNLYVKLLGTFLH